MRIQLSEEELVIIDISDISSVSSEDEQLELMSDTLSSEETRSDRENVLLPKINVKRMYSSKKPSISDILCRKKQVKLFDIRETQAALAWQFHVLLSVCEPDWVVRTYLKTSFYAALYNQRRAELQIVNLQLRKGMVGFQKGSAQSLYEACVIAHNLVNYYAQDKLKNDPIIKSDKIPFLAKIMEKLVLVLCKVVDESEPDPEKFEQGAKRLSLLVMNINKITVVLYGSLVKCRAIQG